MNTHHLNDLLWFVTVVDCQSFSAAAEKLGVSKSVVSKHITALEAQLGVQLLKRTTRKLALTEAGSQVYQGVTRIAEELEQVKQMVDTHHQEPTGKLRINAPFSFGQRQLVPLVAEFMRLYPKIQVELILGSYLADLIYDGVDLAVLLKEPRDPNLVVRKLSAHHKVLCASPAYIKKYGKPRVLTDLLNHSCLVYKTLDQSKVWKFVDANGNEHELKVKGSFSANSSQALLNAALEGLGIAYLSNQMIEGALRQGKLVRVLEKDCEHAVGIYMARMQSAYVPKKVKLFTEFLVKHFAGSLDGARSGQSGKN